jgi:hypothetical protein
MGDSVTVRDGVASFIRTAVPIGVGLGLTWLGRETGVVLDSGSSAGLTSGVAALAGAGYYAVVRAAESKWPKLGWLLGLAIPPSYATGPNR